MLNRARAGRFRLLSIERKSARQEDGPPRPGQTRPDANNPPLSPFVAHPRSPLAPRLLCLSDRRERKKVDAPAKRPASSRRPVGMERSLDSYSSVKDVTYRFGDASMSRCGYCGYALNLSSSARDTAGIGSKYRKQIKKGVVAFVAVDESRFTLTDEVTCMPYFRSRRAWGLFRKRSRLLCRKCGGRIGAAYDEEDRDTGLSDDGFSDDLRASSGSGGSGSGSSSSSSASSQRNYVIKISALQPSSDDSAEMLMFPSQYDG
ncbi:hypothetical protein HU200_026035 [Digitaria exilis]|uniref:Uncharacterized protein n=1 Tax=Digitaria exilis TaxID=1010633 RepID=A0A835EVV0_9POAL|nr:hypothetical protein HU200_026035 [Digitaria exilis]